MKTDFRDPAHNRNFFVSEATGEYVTFLDADDLWCPEWIVDAHVCAQDFGPFAILHSEASFIFGAARQIWFHVDSTDSHFAPGYLSGGNY